MNIIRTSFLAAALAASLSAGPAPAQSAPPARMEGGMLVATNGMTLYTFDKDAGGRSACNGPCAENWPPLTATAADAASGDWSIVAREDGRRQWAYKGKPLYFFARDRKAGDKTGDGFKDVWHVAHPR